MEWNITYHPLAVAEIDSIYFATIAHPEQEPLLALRLGLDDEDSETMHDIFKTARQLPADYPFSRAHGYFLAAIAGFLRPYHYIRGGVFSFIADDPAFARYVSEWPTLLPDYLHDKHAILDGGAAAGVYLAHDALKRLRHAYEHDVQTRDTLHDLFSHGRLAVFWLAVDDAIAQGMGLLEACNVVTAAPISDQDDLFGISRCSNCNSAGLQLYAAVARGQIADLNAMPAPRGLWSRLLRRQAHDAGQY